MMKKMILFAAFVGLAFVSCNNEAVTDDLKNVADEPMAVGFGVYTNTTATRAESLAADNIKAAGKGIGLFAFEQEQADLAAYSKANFQPNFMFNQQLTWDAVNSVWEYSPIKYWPNNLGANVSFFAYAPYTTSFSNDSFIQTPETNSYLNEVVPDANGLRLILGYDFNGPGIEYNMPIDPTKGIDLMWGAEKKDPVPATPYCPYNKTKPDITDKIEFQMKHALSRLAFTIQVVTDKVSVAADGTGNVPLAANTTIKIKRVSLVGNFANRGTLRLYDGSWNVANGDNQTLQFVENPGHVVDGTSQEADQFAPTVEEGLDGVDALAAIPLLKSTDGLNKDNYVMAIPGAKFYIEIEYDVITVDPADAKNNSVVTNVISSLTAGGGTVDPTTGLEDGKFVLKAGTAYMFNLKIGMTSVKFDVQTDAWTAGTEYQVDLPKNTEP